MPEASEVVASEAARTLGLSREAVVRRVLRGELEGRLIGGRWLVAIASIKSFQAKKASAS
jgi:ABC-type Fe3+ transport system permease subunit